jgi:AraC-like DNA-binding protein
MENILFFNTKRDKVDLEPFLGQYNIFILCKEGHLWPHEGSLVQPAIAGCFVIISRIMPFTEIEYWENTDADILLVSDYLMDLYRPKVAWEAKGYKYVSYMSHVFSLKDDLFDEQKTLENDLNQIKERLGNSPSYLDEEIIGSLLRVFLCDIWRVFFRKVYTHADRGLPSAKFARFLIDVQQECRTQRDVTWYADKLGITPKYLTEISNNATGRTARNWIDYYAARVLRRELSAQDVSLTDLSNELNFSSLPVFSRYVKRVLGCSPSEFRDSLENTDLSRLQKSMIWSDDDEYLEELPPSKDETE